MISFWYIHNALSCCFSFSEHHLFYSPFILQEELRPYFSLPKVMDGLFSLANKIFGIVIEPADGLAPVYSFPYFGYILVHLMIISTLDISTYVIFRFGTMMLNSIVSKILLGILLHIFTSIPILVHLRKGEVHGWMKFLLEAVYCHVMVPLQGCLWHTWYAINHHQWETNPA